MADIEEKDDKTIIYEYLQGNEQALEILVARYIKPIYSFIYRNIGDAVAAEDVTQEVFVKVWRNIKKFNLQKDFKPWVFQIAKNASIDYLRKRKTVPFSRFENQQGQNVLMETVADDSLDIVESLSNKTEMQTILATLPEKDRQLIELRHRQGMSFKEISENLQQSINTIKSRYRRIIINIRKNATK